MKKLLLLLLLLPALVFSQKTTVDPWPPKVHKFEKFNATPTNYEIPYIRYCIRKTSNLRLTTYGLSFATTVSSLIPLVYTEEKFLLNHRKIELSDYNRNIKIIRYTTIGLGLASFGTYVLSEVWFRKASVVPLVSADGIGVIIKM